MGKLTISMAIFNSYVSLPEGKVVNQQLIFQSSKVHIENRLSIQGHGGIVPAPVSSVHLLRCWGNGQATHVVAMVTDLLRHGK